MNNISIGRYYPSNSIIHKIDPRVKFISILIFLVCIFLNSGFEGYIFLTAMSLLLFFVSKLPFKILIVNFTTILTIFAFLFLFSIFFTKGPSVPNQWWTSLHIGSFTIWNQSLLRSIYIVWRIFLMITLTLVLVSTTKPLHLTIAIEDFLSPLKLIKIPVHEISLMIIIALRFIPTLIQEAQLITKAQASRGVDFKRGKAKKKLTALISLIIPLFVISFQKAEDLSNAMDVRGFIPGEKRTRGSIFKFRWITPIFGLLSVGVLVFVIFTHIEFGNKIAHNGHIGWFDKTFPLCWWGSWEPLF